MSTLPGSFDQEAETGETADSMAARFDKDWHRAERRFGVVSGYRNFRCDLADETGQAATSPHAGAPEIFERWKPLRTGWERRDLFSRCFLASVGVDQFLTWAVANVFVDNGNAEAALRMLERAEPPQPGADFCALHCGAFAQALLALNRKEKALQWAQEAASDDPENAGLQVLLADALELNGQHEATHGIYAALFATVAAPPPDLDRRDSAADMFERLFARETGVIPSPFFALQIGSQLEDPAQAEEFWRLAEDAFHHSPHFRLHCAYRLIRTGQAVEALSRLIAIVNEWPWLREAHLNLLQVLNHLDPGRVTLEPELRQQVEQRIRDNGWTTDGMQSLEVRPLTSGN